MAEQLRVYDVTVNGAATRLRLSDADAAAYGEAARLVEEPPAASADPQTKARVPQNKARGPSAGGQ